MESPEKKVPDFVLEGLLFERRLQRNLNTELERLNNLLAAQNRFLLERKELMAEIHEAVQQRWQVEEQSPPNGSAESPKEEAGD
jgi:hypothetical protein